MRIHRVAQRIPIIGAPPVPYDWDIPHGYYTQDHKWGVAGFPDAEPDWNSIISLGTYLPSDYPTVTLRGEKAVIWTGDTPGDIDGSFLTRLSDYSMTNPLSGMQVSDPFYTTPTMMYGSVDSYNTGDYTLTWFGHSWLDGMPVSHFYTGQALKYPTGNCQIYRSNATVNIPSNSKLQIRYSPNMINASSIMVYFNTNLVDTQPMSGVTTITSPVEITGYSGSTTVRVEISTEFPGNPSSVICATLVGFRITP